MARRRAVPTRQDGSTFHDLAKEDDTRFLTAGQKTAATRDATSAQNGLMSAAYASKLDGVAANANNYALPALFFTVNSETPVWGAN